MDCPYFFITLHVTRLTLHNTHFMKNRLLSITIAALALLLTQTSAVHAETSTLAGPETELAQSARIVWNGHTLTVIGAQGEMLCVYNLVGERVLTLQIDQQEKHVDLSSLPRGIYPVKVGRTAKKICLQ